VTRLDRHCNGISPGDGFMIKWTTWRLSVILTTAVLWTGICVTGTRIAQAETYIAGQAGVTVPYSLNDLTFTGNPGLVTSNFDLKTSVAYGAKIGHYFDAVKWLGVEGEVFNTTPHLKQQNVAAVLPGFGTFAGTEAGHTLRVTTAAFNVVVRSQCGELEPYAGAGIGLFMAHLQQAGVSNQNSTTPGLNALAGLRYRIGEHVALFGEWKFNYTKLDFSETSAAEGFKATYRAHHFMLGIGYHF
jgi:opacity protein-like surface antigen